MLENPLETPVHIDSMNQVSPTLGSDAIHSGVWSAVIGTLAVVVFMALYYHRCGLIADFAMLLNLVITLGIMCSIGTTLSLPGIAGIVLTVGMAVDANVLIYERLREEMALGKSMKGAIAAAYSRAFATIFDSHTTTLISAIILIYMGTGPVKGFGVTLTIGVALSLFTALVVTRLIFDFLLNRGWLNKIGMLHIIKNPEWDFMKWTKMAYLGSAALVVAGIGYGFHRGAGVLGPEFAGGDEVTLSFTNKVGLDKLRAALVPAVGQTEIQYEKAAGAETLKIVAPFGKAGVVTNTLAGFHRRRFQSRRDFHRRPFRRRGHHPGRPSSPPFCRSLASCFTWPFAMSFPFPSARWWRSSTTSSSPSAYFSYPAGNSARPWSRRC